MAEQGGTGDEAFDRIVEGLDLDHLSFPEKQPQQPDPPDDPPELDDLPDDREDQFYRDVPPANLIPSSPRTILAILAVVGPLVTLITATLTGNWLARPMVWALCLTFVAGAIWLFSHLPERGPGRTDWPDDGAEL